jgi:hypothetical protein
MNGFDRGGITRQNVQGGRLIRPEQLGPMTLLPIQGHEVEPSYASLRSRQTCQLYSESKELCSRDKFESHAIAESFNLLREFVDKMCSPMVVEVMGPQLSRGFVEGGPMEGTDDDHVGHRHDRPFLPRRSARR